MSKKQQRSVDYATEADVRRAVQGLKGIFWALNVIITHKAADEIAHTDDRLNGIDQLILAGELIADEVIDRF